MSADTGREAGATAPAFTDHETAEILRCLLAYSRAHGITPHTDLALRMLEDGWPDDPDWFAILSSRLDVLSADMWRAIEEAS